MAGVGDFAIQSITKLNDPCPLPEKGEKKKKRLNDKETLLYAPMSNVGNVLFDKDAMYINMSQLKLTNPIDNKPEENGIIFIIIIRN